MNKRFEKEGVPQWVVDALKEAEIFIWLKKEFFTEREQREQKEKKEKKISRLFREDVLVFQLALLIFALCLSLKVSACQTHLLPDYHCNTWSLSLCWKWLEWRKRKIRTRRCDIWSLCVMERTRRRRTYKHYIQTVCTFLSQPHWKLSQTNRQSNHYTHSKEKHFKGKWWRCIE